MYAMGETIDKVSTLNKESSVLLNCTYIQKPAAILSPLIYF